MAFFHLKKIYCYWITCEIQKSLYKLRREFFLWLFQEYINTFQYIWNLIEWWINFPWDDMINGKEAILILSPVWRQTAIGVEWVFHLLQETRRKCQPLPRQEPLPTPLLMSRNVEPLGSVASSLLQLGPLHRVYPLHLCRLNSCLQLRDQTFCKDAGGHRSRKEICFISGQSRRCGINTESLSFKNV